MKKTLYVVTSGSYSDYRIEAIFSSKKLAKKYMHIESVINKYPDFNDIREYELNPVHGFDYRKLYKEITPFKVKMASDYKADIELIPKDKISSWIGECESYYIQFEGTCYTFWMLAKNEKSAIKIATDKLRQIIATVGWGNLIK